VEDDCEVRASVGRVSCRVGLPPRLQVFRHIARQETNDAGIRAMQPRYLLLEAAELDLQKITVIALTRIGSAGQKAFQILHLNEQGDPRCCI
jgi:hypothetical protein